LLGSDREGLVIGLDLASVIRITDLHQIADLKLSIFAPVKFRSPTCAYYNLCRVCSTIIYVPTVSKFCHMNTTTA